jgi:hypothetical protein
MVFINQCSITDWGVTTLYKKSGEVKAFETQSWNPVQFFHRSLSIILYQFPSRGILNALWQFGAGHVLGGLQRR